MKQEEWRTVADYEGVYEVSDLGRVRSTTRISASGHSLTGKILSPGRKTTGYLFVGLLSDGVRRTMHVHALVAAAFIGDRPHGAEINHKDGDKANNRPENLEYVTHEENMSHALQLGLTGSLSVEQVQHVRELFSRPPRKHVSDVARELGVSRQVIRDVLGSRSYKSIPNVDKSLPSPIVYKLTAEKIISLQKNGMTLPQIAKHFGVERTSPYQVLRRAKLRQK